MIHQPEVGTSLLQGMSYCFYEVMDHRTGPGEEFHATTGASEDLGTKTHADGQYHVLWHADDRVSIFNKYTYNQEYAFTGETEANTMTAATTDNRKTYCI